MWKRLRKHLLINRAIRKNHIQIWHNPKGNYFNCKIWECGRTEYTTVFESYDKRLYNKLAKFFEQVYHRSVFDGERKDNA